MHRDHYFTQAVWRDARSVMVTWANRVQNESISVIYDVANAAVPTSNTVNCPQYDWQPGAVANKYIGQ